MVEGREAPYHRTFRNLSEFSSLFGKGIFVIQSKERNLKGTNHFKKEIINRKKFEVNSSK